VMDGFYHGSMAHALQFVEMVFPEERKLAMTETPMTMMDAHLPAKQKHVMSVVNAMDGSYHG